MCSPHKQRRSSVQLGKPACCIGNNSAHFSIDQRPSSCHRELTPTFSASFSFSFSYYHNPPRRPLSSTSCQPGPPLNAYAPCRPLQHTFVPAESVARSPSNACPAPRAASSPFASTACGSARSCVPRTSSVAMSSGGPARGFRARRVGHTSYVGPLGNGRKRCPSRLSLGAGTVGEERAVVRVGTIQAIRANRNRR